MIYIKTYCYSEHELPYIEAQLVESAKYVDKVYLYEYDVTHRGLPKPHVMADLMPQLDKELRSKLVYRPVSISHLTKVDEASVATRKAAATHNEMIQRSYFFNDGVDLSPGDVVFDVDVDEIVYERSYPYLIFFQRLFNIPMGLKVNNFFFKRNWLWIDADFNGPTVYTVRAARLRRKYLNNFKLMHMRSLPALLHWPWPVAAHMSWDMPIEKMLKKLKSYAHSEYEEFATVDALRYAIETKTYIFDPTRSFSIEELDWADARIPTSLRSS